MPDLAPTHAAEASNGDAVTSPAASPPESPAASPPGSPAGSPAPDGIVQESTLRPVPSIERIGSTSVDRKYTFVENDETLDADADLLDEFSEDAEELDLTHLKISSLRALGLHKLPHVKTAGFRQNLLTSLRGLEDLPADLEQLDLYDNRLEKMDRRLEHFGEQLTSLDLSFNNFRHIKHLDRLTGLTDLYLCQNDLGRIQGIEALTKITNLELGANRIRKIECLDSLVNLEELWLARNKITKIEGLDKLKNLRLLSIQSNRITKLEGLDKLENLEELYVSYNGLERIEGLENNKKLTTVDVSNNRIAELSGLAHLENLEEFWASYNKIASFPNVESELGSLPALRTVYLEHNPVQKDNPTAYINRLRVALPRLTQIDANPVAARK